MNACMLINFLLLNGSVIVDVSKACELIFEIFDCRLWYLGKSEHRHFWHLIWRSHVLSPPMHHNIILTQVNSLIKSLLSI